MPEHSLAARPPLAGKILRGADIAIRGVEGGSIVQVLARPADRRTASQLAPWAEARDLQLRPASPGQWFLVAGDARSPAQLDMLVQDLPGDAEGVDQTHGRVCIRVDGAKASAVLNKGTALDLAPAAFPVGSGTSTLLGHIGIHLARLGDDSFEIMVLRSFAQACWDDLAVMGREFLESD